VGFGESARTGAVDAIILTGGRSSRLAGAAKADLIVDGSSLLNRTIVAANKTRQIVVVGPSEPTGLPRPVLVTRESPAFGGPAAAIAAGLAALAAASDIASEFVLILACDMPHVGRAVAALFDALERDPGDGVIAADETGHVQPLAAIYHTSTLGRAVAPWAERGELTGLSAFRLIEALTLRTVGVPAGSTSDIDTWADAERFGVGSLQQSPEGNKNDSR
jgi:molybdopterin-guanine dinucleotide biosynthesis protein A